jgi:long-chain acyl-CoA synthetase
VINIYEIIRMEADLEKCGRVALREGTLELTYDDLFMRVDGLSKVLRAGGMGVGSRVVLYCGDCIDYVLASLAVLAVGAVMVPIAASASLHELEAVMERVQADYLLADLALNREGANGVGEGLFVARSLGLRSFERPAPAEPFLRLNPAFVRFSSGTTGTSKGVLLSHESIVERTDAADKGLQIQASDTVLWVLSMSFHFVVSILLFLRRGATIWLCFENFPLGLVEAMRSGLGTFMYAAPFHYYTMCRSNAFAVTGMAQVRMAISTSMKLPADTAIAFEKKFGKSLNEAYGIIEVGLPFLNAAPTQSAESVGKILPDYEFELRNRDEQGVGEIWLRGKGMFNAYLSPWHVFERGAWFDTGDLGRLDEEGYLQLVGRTKNLINFMGMKVFPYEVEAVLDAHPLVRESLVFGESHPLYGQLPVARLVVDGALGEDELRRYCNQELAPYKVPKRFEFVASLPRTASGKVMRH